MQKSKPEGELRARISNYMEHWNKEQKLSFIEFLTHELTISIRLIWSAENTDAAEKVEQMKWINEILHRLPMFAHALRKDRNNWEQGDIGLTVENCILQAESIRQPVSYAVQHSIEQITGSYE